ncbi:MAG: hypothetical protein WC866_03115 [Patescibacteria group bacterium]|jgi:hypothetical protein
MLKPLALLVTVCLAACGSTSTVGPKTTNPPVVVEEVPVVPAESLAVVIPYNESFSVACERPSVDWAAAVMDNVSAAGDLRLGLRNEKLGASVMGVFLGASGGGTVVELAEFFRPTDEASVQAGITSTAIEMQGERATFVAEMTKDGVLRRTRVTVMRLAPDSDILVVAMVQGVPEFWNHLEADFNKLLDSLKPLPK